MAEMTTKAAAGYLCYVGHYQRFQNAGQIWDLAGLAPDEDSSGDNKRFGKISKKWRLNKVPK